MSAVVKMRPISVPFSPQTPRRVFSEITRKYRRYIVLPKNDNETVDWFKSDIAREVEKNMTPAKALRHLREMCDLTLDEVGAKIDVSPQRVHDWESGDRSVSKEKAKGLAEIFKVSPALFI
jgi:DNA-binding XRE family transcriptional regulator